MERILGADGTDLESGWNGWGNGFWERMERILGADGTDLESGWNGFRERMERILWLWSLCVINLLGMLKQGFSIP